jgi:hypothetical protein
VIKIIAIELIVAAIAVALAWLNEVPCNKFSRYGTSLKEDSRFHWANFIVKLLIDLPVALLVCVITGYNVLLLIILFGLIMWVVFDIALGVFLHGWEGAFYLGDTAKIDKLLVSGIRIKKAVYRQGVLIEHEKRILGLGEYAGLVKLLVVSSAILTINFFL